MTQENDPRTLDSRLFESVRLGDIADTKKCIEYGADVNCERVPGITPLVVAIENGKSEIAKHLIRNGSRTDVVVPHEYIDVPNTLIGTTATTPFHLAITKREIDVVQLILDTCENFDQPEVGGVAPFALFCQMFGCGYPNIIELFLSKGADVNAVTTYGCSLLKHAADVLDELLVDVLIENGAYVDRKDDDGDTPLIASLQGIRHGKLDSPDIMSKRRRIAQRLILGGADVHIPGKDGRTPLFWAAACGQSELVDMFIREKCDFDVADRFGLTPFGMAAHWGHEDIAMRLLECGADLHFRTEKGGDGLFSASSGGCARLVRMYIDSGYQLNRLLDEESPLHKAAWNGRTEVVRLLAENGADVNIKGYFNNSPLHYACKKGFWETADVLVELGARVADVNKDGKRPIDFAEDPFRWSTALDIEASEKVENGIGEGENPLGLCTDRLRSKMLDLLRTYAVLSGDDAVSVREEILKLGAGGLETLKEIALDERVDIALRKKAIVAISKFAGESPAAFIAENFVEGKVPAHLYRDYERGIDAYGFALFREAVAALRGLGIDVDYGAVGKQRSCRAELSGALDREWEKLQRKGILKTFPLLGKIEKLGVAGLHYIEYTEYQTSDGVSHGIHLKSTATYSGHDIAGIKIEMIMSGGHLVGAGIDGFDLVLAKQVVLPYRKAWWKLW